MQTFLAYFDIGVIVNVVIFVATLVFSQKIKDFFKGIPSHTRATVSSFETYVVNEVKAFESGLVDKILPAAVKPPAAPAPAAAVSQIVLQAAPAAPTVVVPPPNPVT